MTTRTTPGARFRAAMAEERPLQCAGAINAYHARLAEATGFRSLYISGGGVAAGSCGIPDLGITTMDDVLIDLRRITDVTELPVLVDIDTGWGGAFNIARAVRSMNKAGAAAVHLEDQVQQKRCGHRPNKAIVPQAEMVDRIKAAVDARLDDEFVIMARTDSLAVEGAGGRDRARPGLCRGWRRCDLPGSGDRAGAVPGLYRSGRRAGAGQYHRVRLDAAVHRRRAGQRRCQHRALSAQRLPRCQCRCAPGLSGAAP